MKFLMPVALVCAAIGANAQAATPSYPSCDLDAQHATPGDTGGSIKDASQAHLSARANVLEADIGSARKARHLTKTQTSVLWQRTETVRKNADSLVREHGAISPEDRATAERELDAIAMRVCH